MKPKGYYGSPNPYISYLENQVEQSYKLFVIEYGRTKSKDV